MNFLIIVLLFSWFDWKSLKTDNFTVIYKPRYEWEAREALKNLEYYKDKVATLTGNRAKHFPVVIEDVGAISNGMADPVFQNIHIYTYPPSGGYVGSTQNWYREVGVHEYTHICHLTKTAGLSKIITTLFGTPFQPNMFAPGWVAEGTTVYTESQMSPYEGRLNDGYFDAYIGCRAKEMPSIHTATYSPLEFPGGSGIYIYGGEFFNYLSERYGEERLAKLFEIYGGYFWAPFLGAIFPCLGIDMAAKRTYGKSLSHLFSEWIAQQQGKYKDWEIEGERITRNGWIVNYLTEDGTKLYYFCHYPKKVGALQEFWFNEIRELDPVNQKEQIVASLTAPVSTPLVVKDKKLYYTTYELKKGYTNVTGGGFGYTSLLHLRDLESGEDKVLFSDNIRAFCVLEDGSILYSRDRAHGFGSELWLYKTLRKEQMPEFPSSINVISLDIFQLLWVTDYLIGELKANSRYIGVCARKDFENWDAYTFDFGSKKLEPIVATPWSEQNIELQGDTLIFTANYEKVYSIYAYHLKSHKLYRLTEDGYARNGVVFKDILYFIGLTKDGFDIYKTRVSEYQNIRSSSGLKHQGSIPDFSNQAKHGGYFDVLSTLFKPAVHIPFVFPADTTLEKWWLGGMLVGADATYEHRYAIFAVQDPLEDEVFLSSSFFSMFFAPLSIDFQYQHKDMVQFLFTYPLLRRLRPGLSNIFLSIRNKAFDDDFSRKEVAPGVIIGFRFPTTRIAMKGELPFEREGLGSNIERMAQILHLTVQNYVKGGEISFMVKGYNDPANPDSIGVKIRGYRWFYTKTGGSLTIEYSHPLLKIRKGLWNPNIFFEDLCLVVFTDIALFKGNEYNNSFGIELKLETGMMFGFLKFAPKMGVAITKEGEGKFYTGIDFGDML